MMMNIDEPLADTTTTTTTTTQPKNDNAELNLGIFSDAHFLAASRTFQDHLYFGWFSAAHREKVRDFEETVRNGTLAAPWKDEVWNREHHHHHHTLVEEKLRTDEKLDDVEPKTSFTILCESSARTGYVLSLHIFFFLFLTLTQGVPHKLNFKRW